MKKLLIDASSLKKAVQLASKVINKSSVLPALDCFSCYTSIYNGRAYLHINSTDLENSISVCIPCEAKEKFRFLLHSDELNFIEKADEQPLTILYNDKTSEVSIQSETETVSCGGDNKVRDYPLLPNFPRNELVQLENDFFSEIKTSLKFVEPNKNFGKQTYQGVLIETSDNSVTICATDAHILRTTKLNAVPAIETKFTMNPAFCKLISSFKKADNIHLSTMKSDSDTYTIVDMEINNMKVTITGKNFDCEPLNFRRVIPEGYKTCITLEKQDLQKRLDKAMLYTNRVTYQGIFSINGHVVLTAKDEDLKKSYRTVFATNSKLGEDIDISFNLSLLKRLLVETKCEIVTIELNKSNQAAIIKDGNTVMLIMPLQLN